MDGSLARIKPSRPVLRRDHPLAKGLVAAWPVYEGAGEFVYDVSGYQFKGTWNGTGVATRWQSGPKGPVIGFNGTTDYVDCGNQALLNGAAQATLMGWFNRIASTDKMMIGPYRNDLDGMQIALWNDGNIYVDARNNSTPYSQVAYSLLGWHYFALVFDGTQPTDATKLLFYIDGKKQTLTAGIAGFPTTISWSTMNLGRDSNLSSNRFGNMSIDDVRLYNRTLNVDEVRSIYQDPWAIYRPKRFYVRSFLNPSPTQSAVGSIPWRTLTGVGV